MPPALQKQTYVRVARLRNYFPLESNHWLLTQEQLLLPYS
jgi:hypothetical protein